ncbi:hypothetical protein HY409_02545 [Candidatus Gottesmanbacteria bacterium]|nr:hypothetical protein [Candidatus Gottesmanbacteria bacterium]
MNKEVTARWIKSIGITGIVFLLFSLYLWLRRGYYNDYIINKVFGSTSAVVAGLTLIIGPLAHRYRLFSLFMPIRRELGLLALALALFHVYYSVFLLPNKFPVSWFINEITPITFGGIAIAIWVYVASISSNKSITALGSDSWRWRQKIAGHTAFIAVYLHLVIMKYQGWISWWQGKVKVTPELANPSFPPASTFVFLIMTVILIYRGLLIFRKK